MKFFEDIVIGETDELGRHKFTADDIKRFAMRFDPQAFHMDEEAAKQSHFGGLIASGWHTAAIFMQLFVGYMNRAAVTEKAAGNTPAQTGISPGFKNLKWIKPVYAGDELAYGVEITGKREVSRPGWGLIFSTFHANNQKNERVFEFEAIVFIQRRPN